MKAMRKQNLIQNIHILVSICQILDSDCIHFNSTMWKGMQEKLTTL